MGGNESVGGHDIAIWERIHGEIWMVFRRDYLCLPITEFICRSNEAVWLARRASFMLPRDLNEVAVARHKSRWGERPTGSIVRYASL